METKFEVWIEWLNSIEVDGVNLNTWEESFIESIREKVDRFGNETQLSDRQLVQLERIYTQRVP